MVDSSCLIPQAVAVAVARAGQLGPAIPPVMEGVGPRTHMRAEERKPSSALPCHGPGSWHIFPFTKHWVQQLLKSLLLS